MPVDVQVSSINTSFSTSIRGSPCCQLFRASCTSSRSCSLACRVFFEREMPFVQLMPQGTDLDRYPLSCQTFAQLRQAQPRLLFDPGAQHRLPLRHPRTTMTTDLQTAALARLLSPLPHPVNPHPTDFQPTGNRRRTFSAIQRP